jgi:hypothetical protein
MTIYFALFRAPRVVEDRTRDGRPRVSKGRRARLWLALQKI